MKGTSLATIPQSLWEFVRIARWRLLLVDVDSVRLAGCDRRRDEASWQRVVAMLRQVSRAGHTSLALASARPVPEMDAMLGPIEATFIGEHGWETRELGRDLVVLRPSESVTSALDRAVHDATAEGWGSRVTRTRTSVLLTTCDLPFEPAESLQEACKEVWDETARRSGMRRLLVPEGVELRAWERNLGTSERTLMSHMPPGTLPAFLGDDQRDQGAFEAVQETGYGIRVGADERPSIAGGLLRSTDEICAFLELWSAAIPVVRKIARAV